MAPLRLMLLAFAIGGIAAAQGAPPAVPLTREVVLAHVAGVHGLTRADAIFIAKAYFSRNVGCGEFTGISDGADSWVVEGLFGFAAEPIKGFIINKRTGAITSPVGPSYANLRDLLGT
jgi:hypothetical protein